MDKGKEIELIDKFLNGTISAEEEYIVLSWYKAETLSEGSDQPTDEDVAALRRQMLAELKRRRSTNMRRLRYRSAAAIITVLLGVALTIYLTSRKGADQLAMEEIEASGNKATLTLADGRSIDLSDAHTGIVVADGITYQDGSAVEPEGEHAAEGKSLTLTTPKGGTYSITLVDGTRVWLNSETVLRYPTQFAAEERVVFLSGEAYFEVAKINMHTEKGANERSTTGWPFRVEALGQHVEVMGTEFNVEAYPNSGNATTTLVSGKVRLSGEDTRLQPVVLKPGQQARRVQNVFSVKEVNVLEFTAWREGYFYFNDVDLAAALRQFERWYDIEVAPFPQTKRELFSGKINRSLSLAEAIAVLEDIAGRRIAVAGKTVTVN